MKVNSRVILGIIVTLCLVAFIPSTAYARSGTVKVSFYGGGGPKECGRNRTCQGSLTANGEVFDMNKVSVAHKTLPFGTKVQFCLKKKCLVAKVNDRGPFVEERDYDLSKKAADILGIDGVTVVKAKVLGI